MNTKRIVRDDLTVVRDIDCVMVPIGTICWLVSVQLVHWATSTATTYCDLEQFFNKQVLVSRRWNEPINASSLSDLKLKEMMHDEKWIKLPALSIIL